MKLALMEDALLDISDSIKRKKGSFALCSAPDGDFNLLAGHHRTVAVPGGLIVSLKLKRSQVETLRDMCNDALETG